MQDLQLKPEFEESEEEEEITMPRKKNQILPNDYCKEMRKARNIFIDRDFKAQ